MTYPAPKSKGNILTDAIGGKSDCHAMTSSKTFQGKKVVYWFCWGKNGQKIPAVAAMWSEVKPDLFASANVTPPPQSVGNTLTRRDGAKSDCHLADHLVNKEKVTVSQWVCWSND